MRGLVFALSILFCGHAAAQTSGSSWPPAYPSTSYDYAVSCFAAASLSKFYADRGSVPLGSNVQTEQTLYNSYVTSFRPILNERARRERKSDQAVQSDLMAAMGNWDGVSSYTNSLGLVSTGRLAGYFARLEYLIGCGEGMRSNR